MANYIPPTENLPIFDNSVFTNNDTPVTIDYANKHYLKYPNAQGTENLQAITVSGTASFLSTNPPTSSQTIPASTDSSNKIPTTAWVQSALSSLVPSGTIIAYAGTSAPTGYLICNGQTVSQTTYATLYAILGTTYGSNAGGLFTLPDLRNRAPFGSASVNPLTGITINGRQLGVIYTPSIYGGNQTLATNQIADHTHTLSFPNADYVYKVNTTSNTTTGGSSDRAVSGPTSAFPTLSGGISTITPNFGQSDYLPPFCCVNYIIKY